MNNLNNDLTCADNDDKDLDISSFKLSPGQTFDEKPDYRVIDLKMAADIEYDGRRLFGRYAICRVVGENTYFVAMPWDRIRIPLLKNSPFYLKWLIFRKRNLLDTFVFMLIPKHLKEERKLLTSFISN